jgi:hypothetical protein
MADGYLGKRPGGPVALVDECIDTAYRRGFEAGVEHASVPEYQRGWAEGYGTGRAHLYAEQRLLSWIAFWVLVVLACLWGVWR